MTTGRINQVASCSTPAPHEPNQQSREGQRGRGCRTCRATNALFGQNRDRGPVPSRASASKSTSRNPCATTAPQLVWRGRGPRGLLESPPRTAERCLAKRDSDGATIPSIGRQHRNHYIAPNTQQGLEACIEGCVRGQFAAQAGSLPTLTDQKPLTRHHVHSAQPPSNCRNSCGC